MPSASVTARGAAWEDAGLDISEHGMYGYLGKAFTIKEVPAS
jgi:hypothetical protein